MSDLRDPRLGYIPWTKIHAKVYDNALFQPFGPTIEARTDAMKRLMFWIKMLMLANHYDYEDIPRGEFNITSSDAVAESGLTRHQMRQFLDDLEAREMITRERTGNTTKIKIVKFFEYQSIIGSSLEKNNENVVTEVEPRKGKEVSIKNINHTFSEAEMAKDLVARYLDILTKWPARYNTKAVRSQAKINVTKLLRSKRVTYPRLIEIINFAAEEIPKGLASGTYKNPFKVSNFFGEKEWWRFMEEKMENRTNGDFTPVYEYPESEREQVARKYKEQGLPIQFERPAGERPKMLPQFMLYPDHSESQLEHVKDYARNGWLTREEEKKYGIKNGYPWNDLVKELCSDPEPKEDNLEWG